MADPYPGEERIAANYSAVVGFETEADARRALGLVTKAQAPKET